MEDQDEPAGLMDPPLKGVRILSVEQYGAGPFATLYLSDMGAEIIKIEAPLGENGIGGDQSRQSGPHFLGANDSHFFQTFNLGKRSITLDIRKPEGRAVFQTLVKSASAVVNNLRGDQSGKLGLDYATLSAINPAIVCAHLSGYGRTGSRRDWPAYDYLLQAEAGFFSLTGEPSAPPTRMGLSVVDYLTGITTAFAVSAALFGALRTGKGRDVDVTLYDVAMHQLTYPAAWYLNEGYVAERRPRSGHPSVVPCETFPTSDGHIFIMCILPKFWETLCEIVGLPELVDDVRFKTPKDRSANRQTLVDLLDPVLATKTSGEWMALMSGRVPVAPLLTMPQALDNPYFVENGGIQTFDHPDHAGFRIVSSPIRLDGRRATATAAPKLGADTVSLLAEAGFDSEAIGQLRTKGII